MRRYYYAFCILEDESVAYCIFDPCRSSDSYIAACDRGDDAQKIVDALNATCKPAPSLGVFG
jgi:hypothetical protein